MLQHFHRALPHMVHTQLRCELSLRYFYSLTLLKQLFDLPQLHAAYFQVSHLNDEVIGQDMPVFCCQQF